MLKWYRFAIMTTDTESITTAIQPPEQVLLTWFADEATGRLDLPQGKRWFRGGDALDKELKARFSSTIEAAASGQLDHWLQEPDSTLALIVLLDQFTRNIHRGTAAAFAYDAQALAACEHALDHGYDKSLPLTQRVFMYLPLEHDESMKSQERSVALYQQLVNEAPEDRQEFARNTLDYAQQHYQIIEQFGRYPYRNAVLGRTNTPEEAQWLSEQNTRFGQ